MNRHEPNRSGKGERGSVLTLSAIAMLGVLLAVGLGVDISHFYLAKTELQNAADAAPLRQRQQSIRTLVELLRGRVGRFRR
jgi:uncharacterized membrane protein